MHWDPQYSYPGGQFYTVTWNILLALARLHATNPIDDEHEDVLVGRLLYEGGVTFELVTLSNQQAFDLDEDNLNEWDWSHNVMDGAINPHKMKDDEAYLRVAAWYGDRNFTLEDRIAAMNRTKITSASVFHRGPD